MGKITVDLDVNLVKKKMILAEFSDQVGISLSNLSVLKTNKTKIIRFPTLSETRRVPSYDVGDLLRYEGGEGNETNL